MRTLLAILSICCIACGESAVTLKPLFEKAAADDCLTWEVEGVPEAWLTTDVTHTPTLLVVPPQGVPITRRCFLSQDFTPGQSKDGPEFVVSGTRSLRVRHSPRQAGHLRWTLYAPEGGAVAAGALDVGPGSGPVGPIRIAKDNPRILSFADGTPFLALGPNVGWADGPDRLGGFARYFQAMQQNGCTHARTWFSSWCGQVQGNTPDELRLDHAWLMDQILVQARANHLRLTLVLDNFHDLITGKCAPWGITAEDRLAKFLDPALSDAYRKRVAYCLARWGADDTVLAWEPFNEVDMAQPIREKALPWAAAALRHLGDIDVDHRLRTLSWAGDDFERAMTLPGVDIAQLRGYVLEWTDADLLLVEKGRDGVGMLLDGVKGAQRIGKPFLIAEVGYQGTNERNEGNGRDSKGFLLRQQAWAGFMLGGCGSSMNWWWDVYIDRQNLWGVYQGLAKTVTRLDWTDRDLAPMAVNSGGALRILGWLSARQGLVWPQHRLDTWHAQLVQNLPRPAVPSPVVVGLSGFTKSAGYRIHAIDMVSGAEKSVWDQAAGSDGRLDLTVPAHTVDVVYWIEFAAPPVPEPKKPAPAPAPAPKKKEPKK